MGTTHKSAGAQVAVERDYRLVGEKAEELAKEILVDGKKVSDVKIVKVDFKVNKKQSEIRIILILTKLPVLYRIVIN